MIETGIVLLLSVCHSVCQSVSQSVCLSVKAKTEKMLIRQKLMSYGKP